MIFDWNKAELYTIPHQKNHHKNRKTRPGPDKLFINGRPVARFGKVDFGLGISDL